MKQLTWCLTLPLTIISFGTFTKWWYVLPVDAPDTMMTGFPLAFVSDGWFTSMSLQIFLSELIIDFLVYFLCWFIIMIFIKRYFTQIKIFKILTGILWIFSTLVISIAVLIASISERIIKVKRDWSMQVLVTGYKLTWKHQDRPDFAKYDPKKR